jgi:tetratricopeptide (TPR) repeat protein
MTSYIIIFICAFWMLSTRVDAETIENSQVVDSVYGRELIKRGEFENVIEKLRLDYSLFPLNQNVKRNLAETYSAYGLQFFKQKQYEQADANFSKAVELYPEEATYAMLRGICNYHLKKYDVARYELERARSRKPDSVELLYFLGLTLYETENRLQAMELWEQALKLSPGRKEIIDILAKARKETGVESGMDTGHSARFDLSYDPGVDTSFALAILDVLESAANQVGAELGHFPEAHVPVAIYKRDDFKTVTDAPDWSGGAYDGKIRIPFGAMKELTPAMRGILFHEYAHVVVFDITRGNCPLWLNEGIAEMFGLTQYNRPMPNPGQAARKGTSIDFRKLEKGFRSFSAADAALAYQQSFALVNYLVTTYGWHRVNQILSGLGKGMTPDEAITSAFSDFNLGYDGIVKEWRDSVDREMAGKN